MNWIHDTLAGFGRHLGLDSFALDHTGQARITLADGGLLGIEVQEAGLRPTYILYRAAPLPLRAAQYCEQALRLTDYRRGLPWTIQAGVITDSLFLVLRLPEHALSISTLEQAFDLLQRLHAEVAAAARG